LDLETGAVAASWTAVDDRLPRWQAGFDELLAVVAGRLPGGVAAPGATVPARAAVGRGAENSWTIAEQVGELSPDGMQRLLNFYRWDADAVRDDLRGYVLEHLADPGGWWPMRPAL
jgi:hypothetical protein